MILRKHQRELDDVINGIISGSSITEIIISACPGSGKSLLPQIAGKLITAGLADALCWVVPRLTLQSQGESDFQNPFYRKMINHNLSIRSSTNDKDPCRDVDGFSTTFQALAVDKDKIVLSEFKSKRYILIIDENHHVSKNTEASWYEAIKPLADVAKYTVLMTGTMSRGDNEPIAFIPYKLVGSKLIPDLNSNRKTAVIIYTRSDALSEKAIIPLTFHLSDGQAKWINKDGVLKKADISSAPSGIAAQALFTAISTEFARTLLETGLLHWQQLKKQNHMAKVLIVTANYEEAQKISQKLSREMLWLKHGIATSHKSKEAQRAIKQFKKGIIDALVAINMVYEGLDVPSATHIICLTNIRSAPWIEQMVARVVRVDPQAGQYEGQVGHVFAPDDVYFRKIVAKIEKEQLPFAKKTKQEQMGLFGTPELNGAPDIKIQPLSSTMSGQREIFLGGRVPMTYLLQTPSEIEANLRNKIEQHVRLYSFNNRYQNGQLNSEIKTYFGKARAEMTADELDNTYEWVKRTYPIGTVGRGSGRIRVPTKARLWTEK